MLKRVSDQKKMEYNQSMSKQSLPKEEIALRYFGAGLIIHLLALIPLYHWYELVVLFDNIPVGMSRVLLAFLILGLPSIISFPLMLTACLIGDQKRDVIAAIISGILLVVTIVCSFAI